MIDGLTVASDDLPDVASEGVVEGEPVVLPLPDGGQLLVTWDGESVLCVREDADGLPIREATL